jgi:hypothetical protein
MTPGRYSLLAGAVLTAGVLTAMVIPTRNEGDRRSEVWQAIDGHRARNDNDSVLCWGKGHQQDAQLQQAKRPGEEQMGRAAVRRPCPSAELTLIATRLHPDLLKRLRVYAAANDTSMQAVITAGVESTVGRKK